MSVADYLKHWLSAYATDKVARKTYERYEEIVRLHLVPALGGYRLTALKPLHIQQCYGPWLQSGRRDGRGGLSARTVLHHHRILREALQQAVRWQLLVRNPADAVQPPRALRPEMRALDEADTAALLKFARTTQLYLPVLLAVTTGLRRGEILALRWEDLDLGAGRLAVRRTLEQTKAGLAFKQPKTQKSVRVVTLPSMTVEALRRNKTEQAKLRLLLGPAYQENGLVCARKDGSPFDPRLVSHMFHRLVRRSGLQPIRFHDLRHGHATQLLREGIHPKVVSERLGHSTVGITLDVYSHVLPGMQEEAARRIDSVLRAALEE